MNQSIRQLLDSTLAPATANSYRNAFRHYKRFHAQFYTLDPVLPISTARLAQFIAYCHDQHFKGSTITSMVSALAYLHNINSLPDPSKVFIIKKLLYGLRKHSTPDRRLPISYAILQNLLTALPSIVPDSSLRLLCQTMFVTAFFALLRIGELTVTSPGSPNTILVRNLSFHFNRKRVHSASILFQTFKHSQGQSATVTLKRHNNKKTCPVRLLFKYRKHFTHISGPLFCFECGCPVSSTFFRSILRSCVLKCGLDASAFTTHSFRIGGATHAYECNLADARIKLLGRWKSNAFMKYIRPASLT